MGVVIIKNDSVTFRLEAEGVLSPAHDDSAIASVMLALVEFRKVVPLVLYKVQKKGDGLYSFEFNDGPRHWNQTLGFVNADLASEPWQTFDVADHWLLSEFTLNRDVRDGAIGLIRKFQITLLKCEWN